MPPAAFIAPMIAVGLSGLTSMIKGIASGGEFVSNPITDFLMPAALGAVTGGLGSVLGGTGGIAGGVGDVASNIPNASALTGNIVDLAEPVLGAPMIGTLGAEGAFNAMGGATPNVSLPQVGDLSSMGDPSSFMTPQVSTTELTNPLPSTLTSPVASSDIPGMMPTSATTPQGSPNYWQNNAYQSPTSQATSTPDMSGTQVQGVRPTMPGAMAGNDMQTQLMKYLQQRMNPSVGSMLKQTLIGKALPAVLGGVAQHFLQPKPFIPHGAPYTSKYTSDNLRQMRARREARAQALANKAGK